MVSLSEKECVVEVQHVEAPTRHSDNAAPLHCQPATKLQKWATSLLRLHHLSSEREDPSVNFAPLTMVSISDTCSSQPEVPDGDILVHTGNLSKDNSITAIQTQLTWLYTLPHKHKILIAGDFDAALLDQAWSKRNLNALTYEQKRHEDSTLTPAELYFGDLIYLRDSGVTLNFANSRQILIFGSPSPWARTENELDLHYTSGTKRQRIRVLRNLVPRGVDVLLTNETIYHLDDENILRYANLRMIKQLIWSQPKMVVSRHMKSGGSAINNGSESIVFDGVRGEYEGIMAGAGGYDALYRMWIRVLVKRTGHGLRKMVCLRPSKDQRTKVVSTTSNNYNYKRRGQVPQAVVVHV